MKCFTPIVMGVLAWCGVFALAQSLPQTRVISHADFFDDFNDGVADNWLPFNASRWQISMQNGSPANCLSVANPNGNEHTVMNALTWSTFALEVDAKSLAGVNQNYFIAFGMSTPGNLANYYYLRFTVGGIDLFRVSTSGSPIIASTPGDFVSGNQYRRLRIERQSPSIKVFVDGQLLLQAIDATFSAAGYIGFGAFNSTAGFDNVSITSSVSAAVGPVVFVSANILDDNFSPSRGDNDGRAESCELLELEVALKNLGTTTATNVGVPDLSCADPDISILDPDNCWGNIAGGETKNNECQFVFKVNPTLTQNKTVMFSMTIYADNGGPWTSNFSINVYAQDDGQYFCGAFEALEGVSSSAVAWADVIGNDGRLDFLVIGRDDYLKEITQFYRNDQGGYFTDVSAGSGLSNVHGGSLAWGNYDNDNEADLDLLLTGATGSVRVTQIYRYDGLGRFTAIADNLPDVSNGTGVWGDYDNDGDLDILLAGSSSSGTIAEIYKNTKGIFTPVNAGLRGVAGGSVAAWGDYDNDGDLDILLAGEESSGLPSTKIYRNTNGVFNDIAAPLPGVADGALAWGDYDGDGNLDILLAGRQSNGVRLAKVYRNINGTFFDANAGLVGIDGGSAVWGDFDNDGDLDILLTGDTENEPVAKVYRNDGTGFYDIQAALTGVKISAAAWGDYDNDGALDVLAAGEDGGGALSVQVYRNIVARANTAPTIPANLTSSPSGSSVTLNWNKAIDNQTRQNGLTYNLRVGTTTPNGPQIVSPLSNVTNGFRRVPQLGNTGHPNGLAIKNLAPGTYYWSVQAIDNAFAGSAFAPERSFVILPTPTISRSPATMTFTALTGGANPASQTLQISNSGGGTLNWSVSANQTWLTLSPGSGSATGEIDNVSVSANIAGLAAGTYSATITIAAVGATNTPQTTTVTLTITSSPTIFRSPATMTFTAVAGGANPASQTLQISNSGGGTLNWSVSANQTWLTLSPSSGSSTGEIDNVSVSASISGLAAGTYSATITIAAPGATNTPQTTAVTFNIAPQLPTISRSPDNITFTAVAGGPNPTSQTLQISNSGGGMLNWSVSANQTWLTLSPSSGSSTGEIDNVTVSVNILGLAIGTQSGTITITAVGATNTPQTTAVTLNISSAPPTIFRSPDNMTFTAVAGGPNPTSQTLQISNSGGGVLNWSVSANQTWLTFSPSGGSSTGEIDNVNVSANIAGLGVGIYSATITIAAAGATNTPQQTAITLNIMPPLPTIFRAPAAMAFTAVAGSANPASQILQISNSGGGTLNWSVSGNQTWLSLFPSNGNSTGEIDNVTVSVNVAGLAAGTYSAIITISDAGATNTPQTTTVTLIITPPPTISRVPAAMTFTAKVGGINPPSQTLQISNSGGGTLNWSVSANQTWLTLSPSSGSSTGETDEVTVSVNIAGLTVGTQSAMININASGATNAPQNTTVTLNIEAQPPTISRNPSTMAFNTIAGTNPPLQTLQISNGGGGTLNWSVSANQTWLSLSPNSGSSTGETDEVAVSVNIAGLAVGQQSATITISAAGATNTPLMTAVTLTIAPPPPIILRSPDAMNFIGVIGSDNPATQTLQISNNGGGTLNWNVSSSQAWFSLSPISGTSTGETDNVTVSVNIAGLALGMHSATITISAIGATNTPLTTAVSLNVQPNQKPSITHTPTNFASNAYQDILIQANITDDLSIANVELNYRRGGGTNFTPTAMTAASGSSLYQATIPASLVASVGVEYYITATDKGNPALTARQPDPGVFSAQVLVSLLTKPEPQPAAGDQLDQTAYRLISVPLRLDNASTAAVLADDLDPYDNAKWRLFGLISGQPLSAKEPYVEVSQSGVFTSGKSFFLIVRESNKQIDAGPGETVATSKRFSLTLSTGHNFVATPFNFDIPKAKLQLHSGGVVDLQTYNHGWAAENTKLSPWEGYYLPVNRAGGDTLFVNPDLSSSSLAHRTAEDEWRIQILVNCGKAADTYNFAGVSSASVDVWDDHDLVEAPPIGEYVSLYFPHAEWRKVFERYREDMRSAFTPNQKWRFVVVTNVRNKLVQLRFDGLKESDPLLSLWLIDEALNYKQNLRENPVYQYQPRHLDRPNEFTLLAGKTAFVDEQIENAQGTPEDFVLEQNFPNPFNPETAIRFGLPQQSVVTIKIFDLAGHEVTTLLDRAELPAGRHQRVWDGRDGHGRTVESGIYFCRLVARSITKTVKMVMVR